MRSRLLSRLPNALLTKLLLRVYIGLFNRLPTGMLSRLPSRLPSGLFSTRFGKLFNGLLNQLPTGLPIVLLN